MPPDSEVVAPVSIRSASGIQSGPCFLVEPCMGLTEDCGVIVRRTLVDASSWSASVLMVNPSADVIVLPCFVCGKLGSGVGCLGGSCGACSAG